MSGQSLYDTDFYTWTQQQAARLREVRDNRLDADHLAEEVADLGKSELRAVTSHLRQACKHLLKLAVSPAEAPVSGWLAEVSEHLLNARQAYSPGMQQLIDLAAVWQQAKRQANYELDAYQEPRLPEALSCPFALDELLADRFDPELAVRRIQEGLSVAGNGR